MRRHHTFRLLLVAAMAAPPSAAAQAARDRQPASPSDQLTTLKTEGQVIYSRECASCHGADGTGDGAGPALSGNTALANDARVVTRILAGSPEKGMDPFAAVLNDHDVAAVATFVRNTWDNTNGIVREADVKTLRAQLKKE